MYKSSLLELIRKTSSELPNDVVSALEAGRSREEKGSRARYALDVICDNIRLAREKNQPICQDTGSILFFVKTPVGFNQVEFVEAARQAVAEATALGYLRQNSVDPITGKNTGNNLGPGSPWFHFEQYQPMPEAGQREPDAGMDAGSRSNGTPLTQRQASILASGPSDRPLVSVRLILKGGGSENCGVQYSLPDGRLKADRNIDGVKRCVLDAVFQAQGLGCAPGVLGVCIGGDRATGYAHAKEQLLRRLDDINPDKLEKEILELANKLKIGPMGFGGKTTLLGCKIGMLNRVPASFFVSVAYMCWADRRQGVELDGEGKIVRWLY